MINLRILRLYLFVLASHFHEILVDLLINLLQPAFCGTYDETNRAKIKMSI